MRATLLDKLRTALRRERDRSLFVEPTSVTSGPENLEVTDVLWARKPRSYRCPGTSGTSLDRRLSALPSSPQTLRSLERKGCGREPASFFPKRAGRLDRQPACLLLLIRSHHVSRTMSTHELHPIRCGLSLVFRPVPLLCLRPLSLSAELLKFCSPNGLLE